MIRRQATAAAMTLLVAAGGSACGGLFCQNTPVDQAAEPAVPRKVLDGLVGESLGNPGSRRKSRQRCP